MVMLLSCVRQIPKKLPSIDARPASGQRWVNAPSSWLVLITSLVPSVETRNNKSAA